MHVYVSLQRLLWYFLLRGGGLGPCVSLCARGASLCHARRQRWYGWFCWFRRISRGVGFSRCVPLIVGRPKDFSCGGDFTGAVLGQGYGDFYRCRSPDSAYRLEMPQLQLIFKDVDFPVVAAEAFPWSRLLIIEIHPVAVHLVVNVPVVQLQGHRCSSVVVDVAVLT